VVEDVVARPGSADITAGVDFRTLAGLAEALGLRSFEPVTQRSALTVLGYEQWASDERRRQGEALDRRSGREAVAAWSGRNAAAELISERALGRLRWWLLATPGMPEPRWLSEAAARDLADAMTVPDEGTHGFMSFDIRRRRWWERAGRWNDDPTRNRRGEKLAASWARPTRTDELPVDVADHEEHAAHDRDEVGQQLALQQLRQHRDVRERRRAHLEPVRRCDRRSPRRSSP
jgi:hypothetical protein